MERLPGVVVGVQGVAEHLVDELGLVLVKGERGDGVEVLGRHAVRLVVVQQRRHLLLRLGGASGSSESTAAAGTSSCSSCRGRWCWWCWCWWRVPSICLAQQKTGRGIESDGWVEAKGGSEGGAGEKERRSYERRLGTAAARLTGCFSLRRRRRPARRYFERERGRRDWRTPPKVEELDDDHFY